MAVTRFALLRHGRTCWNAEKRIQGRTDNPLLPEAETQAKAWGVRLKEYRIGGGGWDRIISSDLGRAIRTTELINSALNLPVTVEGRIREQDWGDWTGLALEDIRNQDPELLAGYEALGWAFRPPGGEDRLSVWARSREALAGAHHKWPGQNLLVVTHEGVIKALVYRLFGRRFLPDEPPLLKPDHLHRLCCDEHGLGLEEINALRL